MNQHTQGERRKVVYVMGAGQSGSTILGVTLGNCDGFFYAGELEEWLMTADGPRWGASDRQDFWSAVKDRVQGAESLFGGAANRCIERSSAVFRVDRWSTRRRIRGLYRRVAEDLVAAVAEVAGASYVVDTSHFPLRARELRALGGIDLHLIYLVRCPQEVVASNTRELSPHEVAEIRWRTLVMNANLWLTQLMAVSTFLSHPADRRIFLRHEDFLADPAGVVRQILYMLGSSVDVPDLQALRIEAPLQGNRLIRTDTVAVRASNTEPRPRRRADPLTSLLQLPWAGVLRRLRPQAIRGGADERIPRDPARGAERRADSQSEDSDSGGGVSGDLMGTCS